MKKIILSLTVFLSFTAILNASCSDTYNGCMEGANTNYYNGTTNHQGYSYEVFLCTHHFITCTALEPQV